MDSVGWRTGFRDLGWTPRRWFCRRSTLYPLAMLVASLVSILARREVPVSAGASPVDSGLYLRLGASLYHGHWLGVYNDRALGRGPAFPMFLATARWFHLHLQVAQQLTFLLAALALAGCVRVTTGRSGPAVIVYLVLAFDPDNFGAVAGEVVRDGWYASLSLLVIATWFLAVHAAVTGRALRWVLPVGVLAGFSTAAFWLCREEGPWILPVLGVIVGGIPALVAAKRWFSTDRRSIDRRRLLVVAGGSGAALAVIGVTAYVPMRLVASVNKSHYGVELVNDNSGGQFRRAEADWTRVRSGPLLRDIPITRSQRDAVYRVSPAAAQLEPILESPAYVWMRISCPNQPEPPCDLAGAFTVWAIRDAAAEAGHFKSATEAQTYFGQIASQIEAACRTRAISCAPSLPAYLQPLQRTSPGQIWNFMGTLFHQAVTSTVFTNLPSNPPRQLLPPSEQADAVTTLLGYPTNLAAARAQYQSLKSVEWPYRALATVSNPLLPILLILALVGTIAGIATRATRYQGLWLLCLVLGAAVFCRLVVLSIEATTEAATNEPRYGLVTRALLISFAVVGSAQLALVLQNLVLVHRRRSGPVDADAPGHQAEPPHLDFGYQQTEAEPSQPGWGSGLRP